MSEVYEITITNWKKYQGRGTEYENTSYFKVSNKITWSKVWECTPNQIQFMIGLLAICSQIGHKSGQFTLSRDRIRTLLGSKRFRIAPNLDLFAKLGFLTYRIVTEVHVTRTESSEVCLEDLEEKRREEKIASGELSEDLEAKKRSPKEALRVLLSPQSLPVGKKELLVSSKESGEEKKVHPYSLLARDYMARVRADESGKEN